MKGTSYVTQACEHAQTDLENDSQVATHNSAFQQQKQKGPSVFNEHGRGPGFLTG